MLSLCFLEFSLGLGDIVIGLSPISSFFPNEREVCYREIEIVAFVLKVYEVGRP